MVAAAPVYPYPHPAFPEALLPDSIKSKLQKDSKSHYPQSVLDKQKPLDSPAYDVRCQACRRACRSFVKVFSSAFVATKSWPEAFAQISAFALRRLPRTCTYICTSSAQSTLLPKSQISHPQMLLWYAASRKTCKGSGICDFGAVSDCSPR